LHVVATAAKFVVTAFSTFASVVIATSETPTASKSIHNPQFVFIHARKPEQETEIVVEELVVHAHELLYLLSSSMATTRTHSSNALETD
jgi:hypothetical protein